MIQLLATFSAFSLAGTVALSLLPEGSLKRTAGMAIGLLTLLCWAEGVASLFKAAWATELPSTVLVPTAVSVDTASAAAEASLAAAWEVAP